MADHRAIREREAQVPPSFTNLFDEVDVLPVALRWARFLDEDGTTSTELYWSLHARDLYPSRHVRRRLRKQEYEPSDDYLLALSVSQQTVDYRVRGRHLTPHRVHMPRDSMGVDVTLQASPMAVRGNTGRYALALQWDVYWAIPDEADSTLRVGPKLKTGIYRIDTLQALSPDPDRLEMSDLRPQYVVDAAAPLEAAPAYPGAAIRPETRLALYFEVYHLALTPEGQTHYSVAYRIARGEPGGKQPCLHSDEARTTVQTRYSGRERTAHELIALDLSAWKGAGTLRITVQVTDETTGEDLERTVSFELQPELVTW